MKPWMHTLAVELARGAMNVVGTALGAAAAGYVRGLVHLNGLGHWIRQVNANQPPEAVLQEALAHVLAVVGREP